MGTREELIKRTHWGQLSQGPLPCPFLGPLKLIPSLLQQSSVISQCNKQTLPSVILLSKHFKSSTPNLKSYMEFKF